MPKLSIITINLNNRDGLLKTIQSVVSQSFTDYEWIVIDGGSTDGSRDIIEQYSSRFAYWVSEPDKGIYNAMNKGIDKANGEWIQFLNSGDCLHDKDTLSIVFSKQHHADILYGNCNCCENGKTLFITRPENPMTLNYLTHAGISHQSSFTKREVFLCTKFDEGYLIASDWKFFVSQLLSDITFQYIDIIITDFNLGGISTTHSDLVAQERQAILQSLLPKCVLDDIYYLNDITDGQLNEIKQLRNKGQVFKLLISLNVHVMRLLDHILHPFTLRKKTNN